MANPSPPPIVSSPGTFNTSTKVFEAFTREGLLLFGAVAWSSSQLISGRSTSETKPLLSLLNCFLRSPVLSHSRLRISLAIACSTEGIDNLEMDQVSNCSSFAAGSESTTAPLSRRRPNTTPSTSAGIARELRRAKGPFLLCLWAYGLPSPWWRRLSTDDMGSVMDSEFHELYSELETVVGTIIVHGRKKRTRRQKRAFNKRGCTRGTRKQWRLLKIGKESSQS